MSFVLNNRTVPFKTAPFGYGYPFYFFILQDKKMTPEQLTANLRKIVDRYVTSAVKENEKASTKKTPAELQATVKTVVSKAINDLLEEIVKEKIKISSGSTDGSEKSKVLNLGTYVENINKELNDMINTGIPL